MRRIVDTSSRRERNKQAKRERIIAAAAELFDEFGYAAVTTQQVSDRAEVAAGTLFRYASSKGELLLMVNNAAFAAAIEAGLAASAQQPDAVDAVMSLVGPVLDAGALHPENTAIYQRELIFGDRDEPHTAEAVEIIGVLVRAIADILVRTSAVSGEAADVAAHSVFAVVHFALIAATTPAADLRRSLRAQVQQIVRGASVIPDAA